MFKPGDILYRKYSDKNDLYCVVAITHGPFNIGKNVKMVRMLANYSSSAQNPTMNTETVESVENWYLKVDLNNYDIKDKFLNKIKEYLKLNLGKFIQHETILDNLLYIEILAELKKYDKSDIIEIED